MLFHLDCFQSFPSPGHELNHLLSLCSAIRPKQLLPAVCLELHEPQVVLSALCGGSPLPQGVQWHHDPQRVLSLRQRRLRLWKGLSAALASTPPPPPPPPHLYLLLGVRDQGRRQDEQFALSRRTSLSSILNLLFALFILRWTSVSWFSRQLICVICLSSCDHVLHKLLSRNSTQVLLLNNKINVYYTQKSNTHYSHTVDRLLFCSFATRGSPFSNSEHREQYAGLTSQPPHISVTG